MRCVDIYLFILVSARLCDRYIDRLVAYIDKIKCFYILLGESYYYRLRLE